MAEQNPRESSSNVVQFPRKHSRPMLTKRQLATHLRRTTRWVELRVRDGMPAEWDGGHRERRFDLYAVEAWLRDGAA